MAPAGSPRGPDVALADLVTAVLAVWLGCALTVVAPIPDVAAWLVLPVLLVCPGYALVAVVSPAAGPAVLSREDGTAALTGPDLASLAVAASVALLVVVGVLLNLVAVLGHLQVAAGVSAATALCGVVALGRRHRAGVGRLPRGAVRSQLTWPGATSWVVVGTVGALVVVATAAAAPLPQAAEHTEMYLLPADSAGAPGNEAGAAPAVGGENVTVVVESTDQTPAQYSLVVQSQRLGGRGSTVTDSRQIATHTWSTSGRGRWKRVQSVTVRREPARSRVSFLLYRGPPPESPSERDALQIVYLPVQEA